MRITSYSISDIMSTINKNDKLMWTRFTAYKIFSPLNSAPIFSSKKYSNIQPYSTSSLLNFQHG